MNVLAVRGAIVMRPPPAFIIPRAAIQGDCGCIVGGNLEKCAPGALRAGPGLERGKVGAAQPAPADGWGNRKGQKFGLVQYDAAQRKGRAIPRQKHAGACQKGGELIRPPRAWRGETAGMKPGEILRRPVHGRPVHGRIAGALLRGAAASGALM